MQNARPVRATAPPASDAQRLQVTWVPAANPPNLITPAATAARLTAAQSYRQLQAGPPKAKTELASRMAAQAPVVAPADSVPHSGTPGQPPLRATASTVESTQAVQPALDLNLRAAAQATQQQRRKSPLANAVDAQQTEASAAKIARASSAQWGAGSHTVEESVMADGGRVTRFGGGGCMRVPNPASRPYDESRKPMMEKC